MRDDGRATSDLADGHTGHKYVLYVCVYVCMYMYVCMREFMYVMNREVAGMYLYVCMREFMYVMNREVAENKWQKV